MPASDHRDLTHAAQALGLRWDQDAPDDAPLVQCPMCGMVKSRGAGRCDCGWDLSRKDAVLVRKRRIAVRLGAGALVVLIAVTMSVLETLADRTHVVVYFGAIVMGLVVIVGGVWYAIERSGPRR